MKNRTITRISKVVLITIFCVSAASEFQTTAAPHAGIFTPESVSDQNPAASLPNPFPPGYSPRYLSGFGADNTFTIFFEDRTLAQRISYIQTTTGPLVFQLRLQQQTLLIHTL